VCCAVVASVSTVMRDDKQDILGCGINPFIFSAEGLCHCNFLYRFTVGSLLPIA